MGTHAQISWRKLSQVTLKPRNLCMFSLSLKVFHYTVYKVIVPQVGYTCKQCNTSAVIVVGIPCNNACLSHKTQHSHLLYKQCGDLSTTSSSIYNRGAALDLLYLQNRINLFLFWYFFEGGLHGFFFLFHYFCTF